MNRKQLWESLSMKQKSELLNLFHRYPIEFRKLFTSMQLNFENHFQKISPEYYTYYIKYLKDFE